MSEERHNLATKIAECGGQISVKSALNPILWLCGIITIPSIIALGINDDPPWWLVLLAFSPVITAIIGFFFLLFFDREKLQSEDYQIKMRSLELIEQKGDSYPIRATDIPAIANPEIHLFTDNKGEDK